LSAFYTEQRALTNLITAANAARRSTELSLIRYKSGETDYTTVLSTEQSQLSVEDSVASSQGNVIQGLISIYRALGGGWELREAGDVVSAEVKAEMARRTNWGQLLEAQNHLPKKSPEASP
jgi:outer membrane protein TolC